ncbi:hypothetical protein K491DRAFT_678974 [Lophiostoma macrostomum CBS 122681]|uniref:Uncharacterized protein n=1 Tax=Lophiostoma macrostomum CBS 122681 TaxID=1314788 RepID=A0A6A6T5D5_9PLEO|nr:hypothetical protein K491DRAFT_678974 [Lophiostoma macrostomum CBS 122681]
MAGWPMGARRRQLSNTPVFQAQASPTTFSPALQPTLGMAAHPVQYIRLHVRYGGRSNRHAGGVNLAQNSSLTALGLLAPRGVASICRKSSYHAVAYLETAGASGTCGRCDAVNKSNTRSRGASWFMGLRASSHGSRLTAGRASRPKPKSLIAAAMRAAACRGSLEQRKYAALVATWRAVRGLAGC